MSLEDFRIQEFDKMKFNPITNPSVYKTFEPIFKSYGIFEGKVQGVNKNKVLSYIMLMYDPNTPLRTAITNITQRKLEAATLSNFNWEEEGVKFTYEYEQILSNNHEQSVIFILEFLRSFRNAKYSKLISLEEGYYKSLENVFKADSNKAIEQSKGYEDEIERVLNDLTYDDQKLREDLYIIVEQERLSLIPEKIAEQLLKGKDLGLAHEVYKEWSNDIEH